MVLNFYSESEDGMIKGTAHHYGIVSADDVRVSIFAKQLVRYGGDITITAYNRDVAVYSITCGGSLFCSMTVDEDGKPYEGEEGEDIPLKYAKVKDALCDGIRRALAYEALVDSSALTIEDVIGVIDENSRVEVYDTLSEQIAVYDGKDDLSECAGRPVRSIRAEGEGRIRIEVW